MSFLRHLLVPAIFFAAEMLIIEQAWADPMLPQDVMALPISEPDERIKYGVDPLQFGELRLPKKAAPYPVAVVLHGGCWVSYLADLHIMSPLATALTDLGMATWNVEYRGSDHAQGGWTGTFDDIAAALDHLREIAQLHQLDLNRVIVLGHSAGGHLALWAAARHKLPKESPLYVANPLPIRAAISLSGPGDLRAFHEGKAGGCRDHAIVELLGGTFDDYPNRYMQASPAELLPLGVTQVIINGELDPIVPIKFSRDYQRMATNAGDPVEFYEIEGASHFDVIAPNTPAWEKVESFVQTLSEMSN